MKMLYENLEKIIKKYEESFISKEYNDENNDTDLLMDLFGITPELKRENKQYWGRELGMLFELLVIEIFSHVKGFKPKEKEGLDSPYDFILNGLAIDTKYRVGSGDAGTLKKFKSYGKLLSKQGYKPVILLLRKDNLNAALTALKVGGWELYIGDECLEFIHIFSDFDFKKFLLENKGKFKINRELIKSV